MNHTNRCFYIAVCAVGGMLLELSCEEQIKLMLYYTLMLYMYA